MTFYKKVINGDIVRIERIIIKRQFRCNIQLKLNFKCELQFCTNQIQFASNVKISLRHVLHIFNLIYY